MKLFNNKYTKIITSLAVLAMVFQACGSDSDFKKAQESKPISAAVATLSKNNSTSTKTYPAQVKSAVRSELGTKVMGQIKSIPVSIGDKVKKGDVLLQITDNDLQAKKRQAEAGLNQAKAQKASAQKDLQRFKALQKNESATDKELDNVQLQYTVAENNVTIAENKLKEINDLLTYTTIRAAYDATVAAKYADEGDLVSPGRPLIAIENTSAFNIEFSIPESDINSINKGDTVQVSISALGNSMENAVISDISSSGSKMSSQYWVEVELLNTERVNKLRSGMFANVHLPLKGSNEIFVPISAIKERGQLRGIYVLNDKNEALLRWVRTGEKRGDTIAVLSGISEQERYVLQSNLIHTNAQLIAPAN